jgi:PIN domain nuclease of toxin-antitoxin system
VKLLLDTHIWIWSVLEPRRLSKRVATVLESPRNERWLSPVSVGELLMLTGKGRIELGRPAPLWITESCDSAGLRDAPLTREVAVETQHLAAAITDLADRFIVATAKVYELTLVTADERLLGVPGLAVLANR